MGRFINADCYVSTGQDFLGYNMYAYCLNAPVNMDDPNGDLPAGVKPMQVAINDGMPTSNGPSSWKDYPYIPEEYDTSLSKDIADMYDSVVTWIDNHGKEAIDVGFWIFGSTSLIFPVLSFWGIVIPASVATANTVVGIISWAWTGYRLFGDDD